MNYEALSQSHFEPTEVGLQILRTGRISPDTETPNQMVDRIVRSLISVEPKFGTSLTEQQELGDQMVSLMDECRIVFSTPIMTNANNDSEKPLSACTVPNVNLRGDFAKVRKIVDQYHQEAMGTGFDLSKVDDPVSVLKFLNQIAIKGAESGAEDRPVGNMATIRADHPKIIEFIKAKYDNPGQWKFNISVDIPDKFWNKVKNNELWVLRDKSSIKARDLLHLIAAMVHICAEPGVISMDKLNSDNPVPGLGRYRSTAPCAEVGLIPGETCQFGYINLSKYVKPDGSVDLDGVAATSGLMIRALDNALELSIERYKIRQSANVMKKKRKIGVGVCGLADMLAIMGIAYDSDEGRAVCQDIVCLINYQSKIASHELAKVRGSFTGMNLVQGCRYKENPGYISQKYGNLTTNTVSEEQWRQLDVQIRATQTMRNSSTISLPPTGRSALIIGASTGVEPYFSLRNNPIIKSVLTAQLQRIGHDSDKVISEIEATGSCQHTSIPENMKAVYKISNEIAPRDHILMVKSLSQVVDESISKTVGIAKDVTPQEISDMIEFSMTDMGLKGITFYRDGSLENQPIQVKP